MPRQILAGLLITGLLGSSEASAQTYTVRPGPGTATSRPGSARKPQSNTLLEMELLTDGRGAGLQVQEWSKVFRDLGVSVRIRQGLATDEVGVTEQSQGPLRLVRIVGKLDGTGKILFPGRAYSMSDSAKLSEWLRELETYGAQGNPDGKPLWGLTKKQFGDVYEALGAKTVEAKTADVRLQDAIAALETPRSYPVRLTTDAHQWLRQYGAAPQSRAEVNGFSHGTALAMLLAEFGLGFRPLRTPDGSLELAIDPLKTVPDAWPVGWEPKGTLIEAVPALFDIVPVELDDVPLMDVLDAIAVRSKVPVRFDYHLIEKHKIDLSELRVSHPPRKTSWNLVLRAVLNSRKLSHHVLIDEQGQPFVWVTTLKLGRLGR